MQLIICNGVRNKGDLLFVHGDIRNYGDINECVRMNQPDAIFHLAGQVAMTTSISNPHLDFEINALGTHNLLEVTRLNAPDAVIIYASTNKVYGDLEQYKYEEKSTRYECLDKPLGFDENTPLAFQSPYGCSKGSADQFVLDYAKIYGMQTIVFRHSSMYGGRQYATYDQGWVGWFCNKAIEIQKNLNPKPIKISGNGKQVRDILHADDMVDLYMMAVHHPHNISGEVFNIGGGMNNSLSIIELFDILQRELNVRIFYENLPVRISDQKVFIADIGKVKKMLNWQPKMSLINGIGNMLSWLFDLNYKTSV